MDKLEQDLHGLQLWVSEYVLAQYFFKVQFLFIFFFPL